MGAVGTATRRAWDWSARPRLLEVSATATLVAMGVGIVSGGAVRLTGSGLGCSDWPTCTATSVVAPLQFHAWVEFGNRLITAAMTLGVVLVALASLRRRPRRTDLVWLSWGLVAGIFGEVVLGGLTVLNKLAPPFVMAHFLLGMVLVVNAAVLYGRCRAPDALPGPGPATPGGRVRVRATPSHPLVRRGHLLAARAMLGWTFVVLVLGTVVTSTGPHAGAPGVPRFGFSLHTVAQLHGSSVELLMAFTVATLWSLHRARVPQVVFRRAEVLLVVMVSQAAVGYTQYFTGDPVLLVGVHLAGATTLVVAMVLFNMGLYVHEVPEQHQTVAREVPGQRELARA